jgi:2',3'-cyclic-nucleotide 2'-phosphodiesterase (5'-nucleotidase family)
MTHTDAARTARVAVLLLTAALLACAPAPRRPTTPVDVKILAINDFHGN